MAEHDDVSREKMENLLWPGSCLVLWVALGCCHGLCLGLTENSSRWTVTVKVMETGSTVISGLWGVRFVPEISGNEVLPSWSLGKVAERAHEAMSSRLNFDPPTSQKVALMQ